MDSPLRAAWLLVTCAALAAFCSPTSADGANVAAGMWAGEHVALEVGARGATVEFDCAHGTLDATLTLDSSGRFDVPGTFTRESGGPTRENPANVPARYSGTVKNSTMTLSVVLTESKETVGTFALERGAQPRLFKCR